MKKVKIITLCISIVMITASCQKEYEGEYVRWGDTVDNVNINKLKRNNIPYKVDVNKVFIPKDALDKAAYCCT